MSDNPVAIITGGSRGAGAATAKILSGNGWNVHRGPAILWDSTQFGDYSDKFL